MAAQQRDVGQYDANLPSPLPAPLWPQVVYHMHKHVQSKALLMCAPELLV